MNFQTKIPEILTRTLHRQVLTIKKNSPHILFVSGMIGFLGTTILASKATLKAAPIFEDLKEEIQHVNELHSSKESVEYKKDLVYVCGRGFKQIGFLYAPAVIVGGFTIVSLTGSHITLTKRNAALTSAYAGLSKAFSAYRSRVKDAVGEDKELKIYRGEETKKVKTSDDKEIENLIDPNKISPYARFFSETNINWTKNPEENRLFIQCQQNYANHLLRSRGHIFLNEVYDMLGIERSSAGQVVGWLFGGPDSDNYIDFGMFEPQNARFINGAERTILLDFNVDGVIWDQL